MATALRLSIVALTLLAASATAHAGDVGPFDVREWGVRAGGGLDEGSDLQYYGVHPFVGIGLWEGVDRWLAAHEVHALWVVEPWAAYVADRTGVDKTSSFEIGLSLLFFRFAFGSWVVRPFFEGGEGVMYTDLRQHHLGTRGLFTSQFGGGLEYRFDADHSLTVAARYRHASNAELASSNRGTDVVYGLVGLTIR